MRAECLFIPRRFTSRIVLAAMLVILIVVTSILYQRSLQKVSHVPVHPANVQDHHRSSRELATPGHAKIVAPATQPSLYAQFMKKGVIEPVEWKQVFSNEDSDPEDHQVTQKLKKRKGKNEMDANYENVATRIRCIINGEKTINCLTKQKEVYMPFRFIEKYFQVYGHLDRSSDKKQFIFNHSLPPIWIPESRYKTNGPFLYFGEYDVDRRSKVMLISAQHGVPVSNQWSDAGYIYPIQVVQYGLSHYSKYHTSEQHTDRPTILEDGLMRHSQWTSPPSSTVKSMQYNGESVVMFNTTHDNPASMSVNLKDFKSCLSFDVKFLTESNSSVSILLDIESNSDQAGGYYVLTYKQGQFMKRMGADDLQYGLGNCTEWCKLHRDIHTDLSKFLTKHNQWSQVSDKIEGVAKIEVRGHGMIDNVIISKSCHMAHFIDSADWILNNQDDKGGWQVSVKRVITKNKLTLQPGWYSSMAQGHGISILVRAYLYTQDNKYLKSAARAVQLYNISSENGGVLARYLNMFDWYEEYPTTPPLFVLNGFIYSLFGLYDLSSQTQLDKLNMTSIRTQSHELLESGIKSLVKLLPLYDSGTGTFYDLRHFTIPGMEPNRARWDYHAVHISQLYYLATIYNYTLFNTTADRWVEYSRGRWADHN